LRLLFATMAIVLLPKVLGLLLEVKRAQYAREPLGSLRAALGVATETVFSILLSPILMVTQTVAVFQVLIGRDSGWRPQSRDRHGMSFVDALRFHYRHMLAGALLALACWEASAQVVAWMSPVIAGLVLAAPLSWLTARPAGPVLRALLSTPDCRCPPAIVESTNRARGEWALAASAPDALEQAPRAA